MKNEHLTDEQLQEILDARVLRSVPVLPLHLGNCAACQERLERFRRLYSGLAVDPGFALPDGFADSVLAKIPVPPLFFWKQPTTKIVLVIMAGAVTLTGLLIFVNMQSMVYGALQVFASFKTAFLSLSDQLQQVFAWLGGNAKPFIYGGFGLLGASLVDRLLRHRFMNHSR